MKKLNSSTFTPLVLATSLLFLSACSSSDNNPSNDGTQQGTNDTGGNQQVDGNPDNNPPLFVGDGIISYAYAITRAPNYSSANIERISITDGNVVDGTYPGIKSDHRLATDGYGLYQIGGYQIDDLTKLDPIDTSNIGYQLSVLGNDPDTSNPQALAFLDDSQAYLTRRGSDTILILDPTPEETTSESLIKGSISLANYNLGSGDMVDFPDMTDAVIVNNKLYVLLENLVQGQPSDSGYLAVIDLVTNMEIDTGKGDFPFKGIKLQTVNPTSLHYNTDTGLLYVAGRGNYYLSQGVAGDPYTGGIESIDPITYTTNLLVDDGTESDNSGFFSDAVVVSDTLGYVITLDGYDADNKSINNLRTFNPSTGELSGPIAGTEKQSFTLLATTPDNELWVGIQDNSPGFIRIDLSTGDMVGERIITTLIPSDVVFLEANVQ